MIDCHWVAFWLKVNSAGIKLQRIEFCMNPDGYRTDGCDCSLKIVFRPVRKVFEASARSRFPTWFVATGHVVSSFVLILFLAHNSVVSDPSVSVGHESTSTTACSFCFNTVY